jgi:replication factor A1
MTLDTSSLVMISDLSTQSTSVNIYFKIIDISESRNVRVKITGLKHRVTDAIVGDSSGIIILTLWDEWIDELKIGKSYFLKGGYVSVYEGSLRLNISRSAELAELEKSIEPVNKTLNMSKPITAKKKPRKRSTTGRSLWGKVGREGRGYCSRKEF